MKKFFYIFILSIFSYSVFAANVTLEIIQPQPSLNTENRFYKAYPGLLYNVRLAVLGGLYPFTFAVVEPATTCNDNGNAITLDADTGEISWTPDTGDNGCTMSIQVTDDESNTDSVTWTVAVTTSGFVFVDAAAGSGGDGSAGSPFDSLLDIWNGSATDATYDNYFMYLKTGNYDLSELPTSSGAVQWDTRYKPKVWLAYPSNSPVLDESSAYLRPGGNADSDNYYMDGFEFDLSSNTSSLTRGVSIPRGNNVTFRNNYFHGIAYGQDGNNNAFIFITGCNCADVNWSVSDNTFADSNLAYGVLGYDISKLVFEDNTTTNIGGHVAGPKDSTQYWSIRHNNMGLASSGTAEGVSTQEYTGYQSILGIDVSFNYIHSTNSSSHPIKVNNWDSGLTFWAYRNTLVGGYPQSLNIDGSATSDWRNNVIVNETSYTPDLIQNSGTFTYSGNVTGNAADGIVDGNGLLQGSYRTTYLDVAGWETGEAAPDTTPPELSSATIATNGTTLTLYFSESVTQGSGYDDSDWDIDCSSGGNNISIAYSSGDGTDSHVYTISQTIYYGDTCDIDFNGDTDSEEDSAGNDLSAIVSDSIINNGYNVLKYSGQGSGFSGGSIQ